jgi:hypothetical protein
LARNSFCQNRSTFPISVVALRRLVAFVARHLDTHALRKALDRLDEAHMIEFHEEANGGSVRPATEAVIKALGRADGERGRFLVVKRATRLELAAGFFQRHATSNDLDDVRTGNEVINKVLWNQSGHKTLSASFPAEPGLSGLA